MDTRTRTYTTRTHTRTHAHTNLPSPHLQAGQSGNYAEFARQAAGASPEWVGRGSSYGFMNSWNIKRRGGGAAEEETDSSGGGGGGGLLSIVRAWYGGPENHGGGKVYDLHENVPWLWQEGHRKGKIVTDIVRRSLRDGVLDFNPERRGCNGIFEFGRDWGCWKVLAVQYRYGDGPIKTWLSPSDPNEPYSLRLSAGGGGGGGGGGSEIKVGDLPENLKQMPGSAPDPTGAAMILVNKGDPR